MTSANRRPPQKKLSGRMPAKRRNLYQRGASAERFVRNDLFARGASVVIRAAGSKSPGMAAKVDLVAIFPGGDPVLIQAKPRAGSIPKKQRDELAPLAAEIKGCGYEAYRAKGVRSDAVH